MGTVITVAALLQKYPSDEVLLGKVVDPYGLQLPAVIISVDRQKEQIQIVKIPPTVPKDIGSFKFGTVNLLPDLTIKILDKNRINIPSLRFLFEEIERKFGIKVQ